MINVRTGIIFLTIAMMLNACSIKHLMLNQVADLAETGLPAIEQDDDLDMLQKAFPANIKLFEILLANDPENTRMLPLLAQLYASYTMAFIESEIERIELTEDISEKDEMQLPILKSQLNKYYTKGANYGLKAITARHPLFVQELNNVNSVESAFSKLSVPDVPALFWYGFNLGAYVNQNRNSIHALSKAHLAEKSMARVIELDPSFFYGCAHLFMVAYQSRAPILGGNFKKAREHYQSLKKIAGADFLLADLYYARYYLFQNQNRTEFKNLLDTIIKNKNISQKYQLYNLVAANKAQVYLNAIDQLFIEDGE